MDEAPALSGGQWTLVSDITDRTWFCGDCFACGMLELGPEFPAIDHAMSTGHKVSVVMSHYRVIQGMRV